MSCDEVEASDFSAFGYRAYILCASEGRCDEYHGRTYIRHCTGTDSWTDKGRMCTRIYVRSRNVLPVSVGRLSGSCQTLNCLPARDDVHGNSRRVSRVCTAATAVNKTRPTTAAADTEEPSTTTQLRLLDTKSIATLVRFTPNKMLQCPGDGSFLNDFILSPRSCLDIERGARLSIQPLVDKRLFVVNEVSLFRLWRRQRRT